MITIQTLTYTDRSILETICALLEQLTNRKCELTNDDLEKIISTKNTALYIAVDDNQNNKIVGMLTLVFIRKLSGFSARIEDVVVDKSSRKLGIGKQLILHSIEVAKGMGIKDIHLTSRPSRISANNLYKSLGFKIHETNVYQLTIEED
jgi:ribosomal protein S18 acetylase RimI-like enzyme